MANAVARSNAANVVSVDLDKLNYDVVKNNFKKFEGKLGGAPIKRNFPGQQITFKKGEYQIGFGKGGSTESELELVMNAPHLMLTWCKWEENDSGKRFPRYLPPVFPYADNPGELADREALGDLDSDDWETDDKGNPQDPWKMTVVVPVREKDGTEVDHFMLQTTSGNRALYNFIQNDVVAEMQLKPGKLPVVKFSSEKAKMDKKVMDKRGKEKTEKIIWDVPKLAIVGWVAIEDADRINTAVTMGDNGESVELGEVNVKARSSDTKALPAPAKKGEAAKAAGKGKARKAVDESDL